MKIKTTYEIDCNYIEDMDDIEEMSEIGALEYVMPKEPLDMVDLAHNLLGFDVFNQERLL